MNRKFVFYFVFLYPLAYYNILQQNVKYLNGMFLGD
jgi:hypothetical protein